MIGCLQRVDGDVHEAGEHIAQEEDGNADELRVADDRRKRERCVQLRLQQTARCHIVVVIFLCSLAIRGVEEPGHHQDRDHEEDEEQNATHELFANLRPNELM